ncbi:hypothetical protein CNMCM7691_002356 [Aspergillus felis]|uniref:BRCT domain-containing protein n=1 Tax=Aspergillus felis TaxID=1287682 RepID=A0A8H6V9A8_9EURO|nr:hypothetical protein CNMCM7691_002356 [Aspergillus felis]
MPPPTPTNHDFFDPWNSSATGHQRAENPYSNTTSWRETRRAKLAIQFAGDNTKTNSGSGNGGEGRGEWEWLSAAEATRNQLRCRDIRTMMGTSKKRASASASDSPIDEDENRGKCKKAKKEMEREILCQTPPEPATKPENKDKDEGESEGGEKRKILTGTTIYINGSTMPHISDHRLKSLLVSHGAQVAISLARKSVTHVIIGKPNAGPGVGAGAGGGLAAGKLQKEIARGGWRGVKVVGVEWYSPFSFLWIQV